MKMYKKILLLFLIIISIILPSKVFALEGSVNLSCDNIKLKAGAQTTCNISYTVSSGTLNGFQTNVSLSSNLELISSSKNSIWEGSADNGNFYLYTDNSKTGSVSLGSFVVKAKEGATGSSENITLTNVVLTDENYNDKKPGNKALGITILSNNANLASLSVSTGTLNPSFNAEITNYNLSTDDSSITINASAVAGTVSGTGTKNLNYGTNTFNIVVTAPAGNTKTYKITVKRNDNRSTDSKLKSLSVSSGKINFSPSTTNYDIILDGSVSTFKVTAVQNDSKAKISYSPSQSISLNYGQTSTISIVVTAENGSNTIYKVNVTRKDDRSTNNNLKTLTVSKTNIKLKSSVTSYSETVSYDVYSVKIDATVEDSKSKITGTGTKSLKVGSNTFRVIVTAENGSTKTYTITIIRKAKDGESLNLSSDNDLKIISIEGIDFTFEKDKTTYNLSVENDVNKINIKYELSSDKATALIVGDTSLKEGTNKIDIIVTAENGSTKTYTLLVERKESRITVSNNEEEIIKKINDNSNLEKIYVIVLESDKNKTVSQKVLDELIKSKKTLVYEINNNDNGTIYSFELDGNKLKKAKEFSYLLTFISDEEEKLKQLVKDEDYLSLNFNKGGKLSNKIKFRLFIGDRIKDLDSLYNLYYFNKENNKLELLVSDIDVSSGYIEIEIDNLNEYILVKQTKEESKSLVPVIICIVLAIILIALITMVLIKRNKKMKA